MSHTPPNKRRKLNDDPNDEIDWQDFFRKVIEYEEEQRQNSEDQGIESESEDESEWEYEEIRREINSIDDLIEIGKLYNESGKRKRYNIDVKRLGKLVAPLTELKNMIGMDRVKETVVDLIVYYMQDFKSQYGNMLHTVIEGPPGCGKTTVARIIADIYLQLGIIKNNTFVVARRSDLIGKYLGSTAIKTQKIIDEAHGGCLFIDEAYSLGNEEKRDSFSKECIDTINQNLTEGKCDFICIIAGYRENLKNCFFAYNPGLERRFPFRYTVDPYSADELKQIYEKMVNEAGWSFTEETPELQFFEDNKQYFKFNGGDMETLFQMTKIAHSRRVFCLDHLHKMKVTKEDMQRALELMLNNEAVKKRDGKDNRPPFGMYL